MCYFVFNVLVFNIYQLRKKFVVKDDMYKIDLAVLLMFIINFFYYFFTVTRISTYYLYTPMIMLIIISMINLEKIILLRKINIPWKIILVVITFICLTPSLAHSWKIYISAYSDAFKLDEQKHRYQKLKEYIIYLVSKKFALLKKPVNPSRFRTHPAVPELSALCIILAVFLKGGKNVSADSA